MAEAPRRRIDAIFDAALSMPSAERRAFVARASEGDEGVREAVERLLAAAESEDHTLLYSGGGLARSVVVAAGDDDEITAGTEVGVYRVMRPLGHGGMADVYLAERADGVFDQQVALKIARTGRNTEEMERRFARERQILAGLEHPCIARLLDGGVTDRGRPYFAMEHVDGEPIDAWCDRMRCDVPTRLRLFLDVARAVEVAHRNLVVHRDLKPSNILVTEDGKVKLLDFGIAKLLAPGLDFETRVDLRPMTPEFASPEQVQGALVTTVSDVYQLGVLLYVLLTGRLAHAVAEPTPVAVMHAVCDRVPIRPSAVVTEATAGTSTSEEIAAAPRSHPRAPASAAPGGPGHHRHARAAQGARRSLQLGGALDRRYRSAPRRPSGRGASGHGRLPAAQARPSARLRRRLRCGDAAPGGDPRDLLHRAAGAGTRCR